MAKSYRSTTGIDEFFYVLYDAEGQTIQPDTLSRVRFLQNITIEMPQEIVRAHGDNSVAELALSGGEVSVTGAFHKIPDEDKQALFGLERTETGIYSYSTTDNPRYANVIFARTNEAGEKEWVGCISGLFTRSNISGTSKTEGVEFSSEEFTASFKGGKITEFEDEKVVVFGRDPAGVTTARDALFTSILGSTYPAGGDPDGGEPVIP